MPRSIGVAAALVSLIGTLAIGPRTYGEETPIPIDEARERQWLAELGEGFALVRSDHFMLAHDLESRVAGQYLAWMEETYGRVGGFLRELGVPLNQFSNRLSAACSMRWDVYRRIRLEVNLEEGITSGQYDHASKRTYFGYFPETEKRPAADLDQPVARSFEDRSLTLDIASRRKGQAVAARFGEAPFDVALRLTVRHETAHQVIDALCPGLRSAAPEWVAEGLACAFEGDPTSETGKPPLWNEWRAQDFVERFGQASDGPARVIEIIRGPWNVQGTVDPAMPQRYAAAWAVVFYLRNRQPEALGRYLGHLASQTGSPASAERLAVFGSEMGEPDDAFGAAVIQHVAEAMRQSRRK